jgi:hypothetical protein
MGSIYELCHLDSRSLPLIWLNAAKMRLLRIDLPQMVALAVQMTELTPNFS